MSFVELFHLIFDNRLLLFDTRYMSLAIQGFPFTFQRGGGMVPPLRGGTQGGGIGQVGGGMPRETSRQ